MCGNEFANKKYMANHRHRIHNKPQVPVRGKLSRPPPSRVRREDGIYEIRGAHNTLTDYYIENNKKHAAFAEFLESHRADVNTLLDMELATKLKIKVNFSVEIMVQFPSVEAKSYTIRTSAVPIYESTIRNYVITETINSNITKCDTLCDTLELRGSGWTPISIEGPLLRSGLYRVVRGTSYLRLPKKFTN